MVLKDLYKSHFHMYHFDTFWYLVKYRLVRHFSETSSAKVRILKQLDKSHNLVENIWAVREAMMSFGAKTIRTQ